MWLSWGRTCESQLAGGWAFVFVLTLAYGTTRASIDMGGLTLGEWTTRVQVSRLLSTLSKKCWFFPQSKGQLEARRQRHCVVIRNSLVLADACGPLQRAFWLE